MMNPGDKLAGMVSQSIGGPKAKPPNPFACFDTSASGRFTAPVPCWVTVYGWGAGGGGWNDGSNHHSSSPGGGGTGAGKKTLLLMAGQTISWVCVNTDGGGLTVTLPDGSVLTVPGGNAPTDYATGGIGSTPVGAWDVVKKGGDGSVTGVGATGQDGAAGGIGPTTGAPFASQLGGGGGAAGFKDVYAGTHLVGIAGTQGSGQIGGHGGSGGGGGGEATSFPVTDCRLVLIATYA